MNSDTTERIPWKALDIRLGTIQYVSEGKSRRTPIEETIIRRMRACYVKQIVSQPTLAETALQPLVPL